MLTKRKLGKGKVRVTFTLSPLEGVTQISLVGDFNNWSMAEHPMSKGKDGNWTAAVTLEAGREYQFRYLADGQVWHNDWEADGYRPNQYGSDNSVVSLEEAALPAPKRASRKKA